MFEKEFDFYKRNREDLIRRYPNKTIAICGDEIVDVFDDPLTARTECEKKYSEKTIMYQVCDTKPDTFPVKIFSAFPVIA